MSHIWQALRTGDWLTPGRIRGYALLVLAISLAGLIGLLATSRNAPQARAFAEFLAAPSGGQKFYRQRGYGPPPASALGAAPP